MVTISVVIPATDHPATLSACLAAIDRAADGPEQVVAVTEPHMLPVGAARNLGVQQATGDVIVFVDADVLVRPDVFTRFRAVLSDPEVTAVHGSYDDRPSDPGTVSTFRNLLHHHVHQQAAGPSETFWTGLGAVRRSAFLAIGGFDAAAYPHPSVEDIELGDRLRRSGGRLVLDPAIQGTHLKRWTLRTMVWTDLVRRGIPWVALQVKTRRVSSSLNLGWRHRLSAVLCVGCVAGVGAGLLWAPAAAVPALVVANRGLYRLLLVRMGIARGLVGIGLHWLHHLVAVASVPIGIAVGLVPRARPAGRHAGAPDAAELPL